MRFLLAEPGRRVRRPGHRLSRLRPSDPRDDRQRRPRPAPTGRLKGGTLMTPEEAVAEAKRRVRHGTVEVEVDTPEHATRLDDPAASGYAVRCWIYVMEDAAS